MNGPVSLERSASYVRVSIVSRDMGRRLADHLARIRSPGAAAIQRFLHYGPIDVSRAMRLCMSTLQDSCCGRASTR
jgi:hypothetical protein